MVALGIPATAYNCGGHGALTLPGPQCTPSREVQMFWLHIIVKVSADPVVDIMVTRIRHLVWQTAEVGCHHKHLTSVICIPQHIRYKQVATAMDGDPLSRASLSNLQQLLAATVASPPSRDQLQQVYILTSQAIISVLYAIPAQKKPATAYAGSPAQQVDKKDLAPAKHCLKSIETIFFCRSTACWSAHAGTSGHRWRFQTAMSAWTGGKAALQCQAQCRTAARNILRPSPGCALLWQALSFLFEFIIFVWEYLMCCSNAGLHHIHVH